MVRLPGPSKGCYTCRRRRVKCDERQPSCARCEKGGFDCGGFNKGLRFVSDNSRAKRRSHKQEALRAKSIESELDLYDKLIMVESNKSVVLPARTDVISTASSRLWPELNYSAFKDEIIVSFTLAKFFAGDARTATWLTWGYNASQQNINSDALKALSSVYYGRQHHEPAFENEGRVYYSKTLRGLSKSIESHGRTSLDVLLAVMTASCYEMIASPTHTKMLLHAGGVGKLFELRGPEQHRGMFELVILNTMRTSICMKAFLDRKRCFLEKEEWKTIPWSLHPEQKTMTAKVQDIMCNVSGLFEDYDTLLAFDGMGTAYQVHLKNLIRNIHYHLRLLSDWRALWEQIHPGICHEQAPHFPNSPFSTVLRYQDLTAANGLMQYNALYITISELWKRLLGTDYSYQTAVSTPKCEITNPLLNPPSASIYDAAIEICRSVEYHLSPPHGSAGAFYIIFPLKKANDVLPDGSIEQAWLKTIINNLATRSGLLFSTKILSHEVI